MTLIDAFKSTENMLMDAGIDDYRFDSECLLIKAAGKNKPMMMALLMSMAASPRYVIMPAAMYIATYVINIPGFNSFVTKFNNAVGFIGLSAALTLFHFIEPSAAGVPAVQSA